MLYSIFSLRKYIKSAKKYGYEATSNDRYTPPHLFDVQVFYSHFIQGYVVINNKFYNVYSDQEGKYYVDEREAKYER